MKKNATIPTVAIIGLGRQGRQHVKALQCLAEQQKIQLIGSCDLLPEAEISGIPFFIDYRRLLFEKHPNIVVITTVNAAHQTIAEEVLQSGADVVKEKR